MSTSTSTSTTIYSQPACVQCNATYRWADGLGLDYEVIDLTRDAESLDAVKELGYLQAPVVIVRDSDGNTVEHWSGFRPDRLDSLAATALVAA